MNGESRGFNLNFSLVVKTLGLLLLLWALFKIRDLILIILVSVVIASAIDPAARWFSRFRVPRLPAVVFVYVITLGALFTVVPLLIFNILGDFADLLSSFQQTLVGSLPGPQSPPAALSALGDLLPGLSWEEVLTGLRELLSKLGGGFLSVASLIFGGLLSFILILVFSFYLSVQERGVENFLRTVLPMAWEEYALDLWGRARTKIGLWFQGQLLLGILVGILVYLGLMILGLEHALTLAVIAAILELIPLFGPIIAAIPAVLLAFGNGLSATLMVVGLYIIIQQFENHLLQPLVVKKITGMPPMIVIIALLIGIKLAGFLGMILAAPAAMVVMEVLGDFERRKRLAASR